MHSGLVARAMILSENPGGLEVSGIKERSCEAFATRRGAYDRYPCMAHHVIGTCGDERNHKVRLSVPWG